MERGEGERGRERGREREREGERGGGREMADKRLQGYDDSIVQLPLDVAMVHIPFIQDPVIGTSRDPMDPSSSQSTTEML